MRTKAWSRSVNVALLLFFAFCTLYPLYFMLISSVKTNAELQSNFFGLPLDPQFQYYGSSLNKIKTYMSNSGVISAISAIGVLVVSSLSAYAFARFRFYGKDALFFTLLLFLMIPGVLTIIPQFVLVKNLGLINTPWAAILPYIASGQLVTIFVMRTFFEGIPKELFESIKIDGGSEFRCFISLVIPFALPIILSMGLVTVLNTWNDFFWPLLVLPDQQKMTLTVGLYRFMDQQQILYGQVFSAMSLASVPLMVLFSFTMKFFVQGLTSGAIKA
ncbi:carbohydrate ABC transporter permease [Cohnella fermenti]|uniref:Carbohydrate ABC transporter permease n=1 Tax=Cohnella fermenti TaxID=2565925 RepID=A0A4V3WEJ3_9BACL|nr:carbohydrate ABC transporter permease [Cohnella fermenti]THF76560.1 carbohydrate ABC transporter permease [Cohnella fermenti]